MDVIQVRNLVKTFPSKEGKLIAVNNNSFNVKKGEIFGLLGVNGAGKSTTLNILSGLTTPDSGTIAIFGKDFFKHEEEIKSKFNLATAYYSLSSHVTVKENLNVYARLYNVMNHQQKIQELTEKFMISHLLHTKVQSLSSGARSRLGLVKSMLNDPQLLLLDECTVGLDPAMAELTRDYLQKYNQETGCTIIFTSHYMQEVEQLCHRIAFMDEGKIVKVGTAKDLLQELELQTVTLHFSQKIEKAKKMLEQEGIKYTFNHAGALQFHIKNKDKIIYPLLKKFVNNDIPFDDLHLDKPTLEEYFIKKSREQR